MRHVLIHQHHAPRPGRHHGADAGVLIREMRLSSPLAFVPSLVGVYNRAHEQGLAGLAVDVVAVRLHPLAPVREGARVRVHVPPVLIPEDSRVGHKGFALVFFRMFVVVLNLLLLGCNECVGGHVAYDPVGIESLKPRVKLFEGVRVIRVFAASYLIHQEIHVKLSQPPGRLRHVVVCGSALPVRPTMCNTITSAVRDFNRPQRGIVNQVIERHDARNGSSASPGRPGHRAQIQGVRGGGNERCVEGDVHRHLDIRWLPTILEPGSLGTIF